MPKRIFDFFVATIFIVLLSPFFLLIAIGIALDSRGGVFYKQTRTGRGGAPFKIWKFRTMRTDADRIGGALTVGDRDPRVTPFGYFLRKYKMDELPQLFNVWAGEMSLVGPRPEVPRYTDLYTVAQREVLSVPPGITDFASIQFADESELLAAVENPEQFYIATLMPQKLALNLKYIATQNFYTDIEILFNTIKKIISKK